MPEGSVGTLTMTELSSVYSWTVLSSRDAIFSQLADLRVPFDISWLVYPNGPTETFPAHGFPYSLKSMPISHCLVCFPVELVSWVVTSSVFPSPVKRMHVGLKPLSVFLTGPYWEEFLFSWLLAQLNWLVKFSETLVIRCLKKDVVRSECGYLYERLFWLGSVRWL